MGRLDAFAVAWVGPRLQPGEAIQWIGCLMHPTKFNILTVPERYDHYIGIGTDRRLIVVEAVTEGFSLTAFRATLRAQAGQSVHEWWFDELAEVREGAVEGLTSARHFVFEPFPQCGPLRGERRRYDVFSSIEGFDAQPRQGSPYMQWLAEGVRRRAFPVTPAKLAYLPPLVAQWDAQRQQRAAGVPMRSSGSGMNLGVLVVMWLVLVGVAVATVMSGRHDVEYWGPIVEQKKDVAAYRQEALDAMSEGKLPPRDCDYEGFDRYQCVCVTDDDMKEKTSTNLRRKRIAKLDRWCLDEDGVRRDMAESKKYADSDQDRVDKGKLKSLGGGVSAGVFFLGGLLLVIGKTRQKKPA